MAVVLTACYDDGREADDFKAYEGPSSEVTDAEILYSDSAVVRMKFTARRLLQYENGNQDFPQGVYIESYENDGTMTATITADRGHFNQEDNKYTAEGNVVVENLESGETLRTEVFVLGTPRKRDPHRPLRRDCFAGRGNHGRRAHGQRRFFVLSDSETYRLFFRLTRVCACSTPFCFLSAWLPLSLGCTK